MSDKAYNSFRLLGYKINELPNGYFITQTHDGKLSLFDNNGQLLIRHAKIIDRLSDFYYSAKEDSGKDLERTIYNKYGKVIDKAMYFGISSMNSIIQVKHVDSLGKIVYNLYNKHRNSTECEETNRIDGHTSYKSINLDTDGKISIINNDNSKTRLISSCNKIVDINNHYISYVIDEDTMCVINFKGETVCRGNKLVIDTTELQSSNIIKISHSDIIIVDSNENVICNLRDKLVHKDYCNMLTVTFTSEPNVVCISTCANNMYLLNIETNQKSKEYKRISIDGFIGETNRLKSVIDRIDRKTLESTTLVSEYIDLAMNKGEWVVRRILDDSNIIKDYYTLDFKPLVHEFD